jgi:hypothetical protein
MTRAQPHPKRATTGALSTGGGSAPDSSRMGHLMSKLIRPRSAAAVAALSAVAVVAAALASAAPTSASPLSHRPHRIAANAGALSPGSVTSVDDQFTSGKGGFCVGASAPCDGNAGAGDYGTIDGAVKSGFSNGGYGNYAPSTPALDGGKMALVTGTTAANQGLGCQTPGVEGCTGPYYLPPNAETTFPANGFTVTSDVYLDVNAPQGEIDPDVGMSTSTGAYGQDMIFAVCSEGGGAGWTIVAGHNSPGDCPGGTPQVTSSGWYRFVWLFTNVGGEVFLTQRVLAENGLATVYDSGPQPVQFPGDSSQETTATAGGVNYYWLPTLDYEGVPFQNFAVQLGQHQDGHAP